MAPLLNTFPFSLVTGSTDPEEVDGEDTSITGLIIQNMRLRNAAKECLRIKFWVTNSVIQSNDIRYCGIEDYELGGGEANGEGICEYISAFVMYGLVLCRLRKN